MRLRYGCNPHQKEAEAGPIDSDRCPVEIVNGAPGMINLLDALNAWQLVAEARATLGLPAATSFKHVSPAGAAVADDIASAYALARDADPKSSFGDFAAVSDPVDEELAKILRPAVSDGIIAPDYEPKALEILKKKKGGKYLVIKADPGYKAPPKESRELFGMLLSQDRNNEPIGSHFLENVVCGRLGEDARRDLLLGMITLKYTQSNSVGYALGGQMIGIGAGQQSRVDCTKLAGSKADVWHLRRHPKVAGMRFIKAVKKQERINWQVRIIEGDLLPQETKALESCLEKPYEPLTAEERAEWIGTLDGVSLASDGFLPFRDNVDHAARHGVRFIAEPGGSAREDEIQAACEEHGIALVRTGLRLFHH
jgi:phosphoribosylaminoimidazolecarboxamide formyltransferase/IMP cyclohydrolase